MIKRIIFDFDDVIVDTRKAYCDMYNHKYREHGDFKPADPDKVFKWDLSDECPLEKDRYTIFSSKELFTRLKFIDGAYEALKELSSKIPVAICSVVSLESAGYKAAWIKERLPFMSDVILLTDSKTLNKGIVDMKDAMFIDDNAYNLNATNADIKICFGRNHSVNEFWVKPKFNNWKDLYKYIIDNM
ncbi:MAG TPA: HAD hydrolase-like protein [Pseudoneobacillus sp.]|nr:HAD hydrolase-like protein [Pseudoneobacillus sp.]